MRRHLHLAIAAFFLALAGLQAQTPGSDAPAANTVAELPIVPQTNAPPATAPSALQPVATLTVGEKTFENARLTGFDGRHVTFSHSAGIKTVPLLVLTVEQVEALNRSADKVAINAAGTDLTPPSAEAIQEAETLIQSAGGVDGLLPNGNTPLVEAVATQRADLIKALIARGANPNLESKSGKTPLGVAEGWGDPALVQIMKSGGAEPKVEVRPVPKSPYLIELEKQLAEIKVKMKEARDAARKHSEKASSFKSQAAQQSKRRMTNPVEAEQNKHKVQQILNNAREEETQANFALSQVKDCETAYKNTEKAIADEKARLARQMEDDRRREEEKRAREERAAAQAAEAPAPESGSTPPAPSSEQAYVDPERREMQKQMSQAQANVQTAQSMMDIMQSKTAAEKELERQVQETKEKLAKVPSYVKYVVWAGILFLALGAVWFIGLAFYDSMGWGLIIFFTGPIGAIVYFILHPKETWVPFAFYIFGLLMCWIPVVVYQVGLFDFLF